MKTKIFNLGLSGTGKTCYMTAMAYQMLHNEGSYKFIAGDIVQALKLNSQYAMLARGVWPASTQEEPELYKFKCLYNMQAVFDFEWIDYRGLSLETFSDAQVAYDFKNKLSEAGCYNVLIPADWILALLRKDGSEEMIVADTCLSVYKVRLMDVVSEKNGTIPIVFTITKSDLLPEMSVSERLDYLLPLLREYFDFCFSSYGVHCDNKRWVVAIACVTMGTVDHDDNRLTMLAPKNMHLPAMFAVRSSLAGKLDNLQSEHKEKDRDRENKWSEYKREKDVQDRRLFSNYTSMNILHGEWRELQSRCDELEKEISEVKEKLSKVDLNLVGSELSAYYVNGKVVNIS